MGDFALNVEGKLLFRFIANSPVIGQVQCFVVGVPRLRAKIAPAWWFTGAGKLHKYVSQEITETIL
ncbi:hypothetical protein BIY27_26025 [Gibbsiella quercinecans]|nr:hypothetical protein BIY27_26025 [Gibbsiella quercinecans]